MFGLFLEFSDFLFEGLIVSVQLGILNLDQPVSGDGIDNFGLIFLEEIEHSEDFLVIFLFWWFEQSEFIGEGGHLLFVVFEEVGLFEDRCLGLLLLAFEGIGEGVGLRFGVDNL